MSGRTMMSITKEQIKELHRVVELTDKAYSALEDICIELEKTEIGKHSIEHTILSDCCKMIDDMQTRLSDVDVDEDIFDFD